MLQSSTHCGRKISRKFSNGAKIEFAAEEVLRKASRKLSELGGDETRTRSRTPSRTTQSRTPPKSPTLDSISEFDDSDLAVLDCSGLNLGQLPVELLSEHSANLEHLILDENELDEQALEDIPRLDKLETLSLNGNQIKNIGVFLQFLKRKCPNLKFLSLIGNPGWPHPILNDNLQLYRTYALSALRLFPSLQFLDTSRVGNAENKTPAATRKIGISPDQIPRVVVGACRMV